MSRWLTLLALVAVFDATAAEEIVTLSTRTDTNQSYLLSAPASGKPAAVALLSRAALAGSISHASKSAGIWSAETSWCDHAACSHRRE